MLVSTQQPLASLDFLQLSPKDTVDHKGLINVQSASSTCSMEHVPSNIVIGSVALCAHCGGVRFGQHVHTLPQRAESLDQLGAEPRLTCARDPQH